MVNLHKRIMVIGRNDGSWKYRFFGSYFVRVYYMDFKSVNVYRSQRNLLIYEKKDLPTF